MKKPIVKATPIKELERLLENPVEETGVTLSDNPPIGVNVDQGACVCLSEPVIERGTGRVILRCPDCNVIRDIWRGAERLPIGTYCRRCGQEDLTVPISEGTTATCADPLCRKR